MPTLFRALIVLLCCVMPLAGADVPDLRKRTSGVDWPAFMGAAGDGKSPEKGIRTQWENGGLPLKWEMKLGIGYSMPTTSMGRLFVFDREGDTARLTAHHAETGQQLWRFEYPTNYEDQYGYNNGPRCSPVIDGDRVYILGVEGMLHCLNVTDGRLVWKRDTSGEFHVIQNFFGVGATPVIEGEWLLMNVGGATADSEETISGKVKGNGSGIVAFNKMTGEVGYKVTDELASYSTMRVATIGGRRWGLCLARGGLVAFEPATGKVDFQFPWRASITESVNAASPVVAGELVMISETYGPGAAVLKVKPGGYDLVWKDKDGVRNKAMQAHWCTPIEHEGYVYGSSGRHAGNAELRCVEMATGKVMWSVPGLTRCTLTYVDGHFVVLSEFGRMLLIKATPEKAEAVTAMTPLDENRDYPAWAPPIISHGLLYIRGDRRLLCYELIPAGGP